MQAALRKRKAIVPVLEQLEIARKAYKEAQIAADLLRYEIIDTGLCAALISVEVEAATGLLTGISDMIAEYANEHEPERRPIPGAEGQVLTSNCWCDPNLPQIRIVTDAQQHLGVAELLHIALDGAFIFNRTIPVTKDARPELHAMIESILQMRIPSSEFQRLEALLDSKVPLPKSDDVVRYLKTGFY